MQIAQVFVNIPVKSICKPYSYEIPARLSFLDVGWRVLVFFGGRKVEGFILSVEDKGEDFSLDGKKIKPILETLDDEAWFNEHMLEVARFLSKFYLSSMAEAMRLFIPSKSSLKIICYYRAVEEAESVFLPQKLQEVYDFIVAKKKVRLLDLQHAFACYATELENILGALLKLHIIKKEYFSRKKNRPLFQKKVTLWHTVDDHLLAKYARKPAQKTALLYLKEKQSVFLSLLEKANISRRALKELEKDGLVTIDDERIYRNSYECEENVLETLPALSREQATVLAKIYDEYQREHPKPCLLYGITGSGKTRVYLEIIKKVRAAGKTAILLVPEIALTTQVVDFLQAQFTNDIVVLHSKISQAERNDAMFRLRRGEAGIVIGARSAIFTPLTNIGVIILDEEQDNSYKQEEKPYYHVKIVAQYLAKISHALLILGSATPSLESFYEAKKGEYLLLRLTKRIDGRLLPKIFSVDMRRELKEGNKKVISQALIDMISIALKKKEQIILMLNRRGFSTFVMCRSCGTVITCPECTLPMVYHKDGKLVCHHCDLVSSPPDVCPVCRSTYIKYFGSGTEKLETQLREIFPEARIIRMDRDTTKGKFSTMEILSKFREQKYDILLGTQMVSKGHDFPQVTLVGILSADSSLFIPDFRAAEKCFSLITQTAGRAGRGESEGEVLVQTYSPDHYAVQCALRQDYDAFFAKEIEIRKMLFYPPHSRLIKLTFIASTKERAKEEAKKLKEKFLETFTDKEKDEILGPAPALIEKLRGIYRICLLIKSKNLSRVRDFLYKQNLHLRDDVAVDIDPLSTS